MKNKAKVKIDELDKQLICPSCGWFGQLLNTIGPHQIKDGEVQLDGSVALKSIHNCHYCPMCFDESVKRGQLVQYFVVYQNPEYKSEPPDISPAGGTLN